MTDRKPLVLFLCTANSARSQMAEAWLRAKAGDRFEVASAGTDPTTVNPLTQAAMREVGLDTSGHRSKHSSEFLGKLPVRYAIIVCDRANAHCPRIYPFATHTLYWPFDDPAAAEGSTEDRLRAFRRVRDEIGDRIEEWLAELADSGRRTP